MSRHPSRAFRRWCAGLMVLVFSWSLPGGAEAKVAPIELVKYQLRKPNVLIVVESAESMQGLPGETPARYNEVGVDCENGDRFCRLYGQAGRCEFSGMGKQGYVFDDVPVYSGTSTNTHTGGTKIITQTDTGSMTSFTTAVVTSTGANTSGQTVTSSTTATSTSATTETAYQTATSTNSETYYQTTTLSAVATSHETATITGSETYNTTSTVTGTESYNTTSTVTGTQTYNTTSTLTGTESYNTTSTVTGTETYNSSAIAYDNLATSTTWAGNNWSFTHTLGSGSNKVVIIFTVANGGGPSLSHTNVKYNNQAATYIGTATFNHWGNYGQVDAWVVYQSSLPVSGSYSVTGTSPAGIWGAWMTAVSFSGVSQSAPTTASASDNIGVGSVTINKTAGINDWFVDAMLSASDGAHPGSISAGPGQTLRTSAGAANSWYLGHSTKGPVSGASSDSWTMSPAWYVGASLLMVDLAPATTIATRTVTTTNTGTTTNTASRTATTTNTGTTTNTALRTVTTTNTGTTTNTESRSVTTTNTGTTTNTANRTVTTTNTGTTTNIVSRSATSTNTDTTTNTSSRVSTSISSGSTTNLGSVTATASQTGTVSQTELASSVLVTSVGVTTNTTSQIGTLTKTATVTTTYATHPVPDTDDCDSSSCAGNSYCYLQSSKSCSSNSECTTPGDFCRQLTMSDGLLRTTPDFCAPANPPDKICRYQDKVCTGDNDCQAGTSGIDYCVTGHPAHMCRKSGLWCSVADNGAQCLTSDDKCGPATSRMMMVKNAVRRVFLDHAYDDKAVVKIGQMHTYQANSLGSTDNLFPYVKLAEPTLDRSEIRFLPRSELLRGTYNSAACFSESAGPTGTCVVDYSGGGASTTPSVTYTLVTDVDKNDSRYAIPTGDGKTFAHVDAKWGTCGLACSFPSASTAGKGLYEGSYYRFTYRTGVPIDAGSDPNSPTSGSLKNPAYYSTYRGKSFGSVNNYWMLMDAERSDIANENKYGALGFSGASWSNSAEYGLPFRGASGDPLSTTVGCSSSNGAQWDQNMVPRVDATTFGGHSLTPPQKALLNVARLEKNSFGGFHAVGNIAPVACALSNDGANDSQHSVEGYMNAVKTSDGTACWPNHVLLVVDGLPRGPGDVAVNGTDCSASACRYDTNPTLAGCTCQAVTKARSLAASGINVHVIAATTDRATVNSYAASTLNNIAIAGSTSTGFINRPRYAATEDELYFWLNYEMKEALRVRVATTPASAASGSQSLAGVTDGSMLYQTVAELPEWRGSLLGYQIQTSAATSTATSTGTSTSTNVTYSTTKLWDAAKRNGWVSCSASDSLCTVPNVTDWKLRKVFFSDNSGVVRKIIVDLATGAVDGDSKSALLAMGMGANVAETERIVQWMLGAIDPSETINPRPLNPAVMGSVVNSMPISVGAPGISLQLGGKHFYYTHVSRPELVYVGADDGMLHAFRASDGKEQFAFIPADMVPVIAKLYAQGGQRYNPSEHIYGLSGSPKVKNLCVANCNPTDPSACSDAEGGSYNDSTCPVWKTILVMGEGQGGNHPFALDITDPIPTSGPDLTNSLLWHVSYKNAAGIPASELGDTMSVPAFAYKKTTDKTDNRVLIASSYPAGTHTYTKLIDAKLMDGSSSGSSGLTISGNTSCSQDFGMVADVALARNYTADGEQGLIAAYLSDTHGRIYQYSPFYASTTNLVKSLGCDSPLHFSPAVIQLNRNDAANINGSFIFLGQVTNSLMDPDTRSSSTPSELAVLKLTSIGNSPPALDATFGTGGVIELKAGSCTGTECLCGKLEGGIKYSSDASKGCGTGGQTIPATARPTGTPVAVLRTDGAGFQLYTTWYDPPKENWDNCANSDTNGTSYITLHEFMSNGTWAQIAGVPIQHQYVTGVQFVGSTLFVTYGMNEKAPGSPEGSPNLGQTFESVAKNSLQTMASERFIRTAWAERLDF